MKISIVLLSFDNFDETTRLCFESLSKDPDFGRWEFIIVDNASDDGTRERLAKLQEANPAVTFIFNRRNLGFAGGINTGIRQASGEIICLLNNDTICPEGVIGRLAAHFEKDESIGMVAPVSNAAGNEQAIYTTSLDIEGIIKEGLRYANSGGPTALDAYRLDFCGVAIARNALEEIGLLDEGFGPGYYEDFDYSLRMKEKAFRLLVAEDAFIYHRGGATFERLPRKASELLRLNKRKIIEKHGSTTFFPHTRECNLSALAQYIEKKESGQEISLYRIMNRLRRARHDVPKNFIKRWRYLHRVGAVARRIGIEF